MIPALTVILCLFLTLWGGDRARAAEPAYLEGRLLIATPEMPDGGFAETVIYMVQHDARGALGLIVNQPVGRVPLSALFERLGLDGEELSGDALAYRGGPVEPGVVFILHSDDYESAETTALGQGLALTTHPKLLADSAAGQGPAKSLFILGYAGWGPGQLEFELERGGWISAPYDEALVFDKADDAKWEAAIALYSIEL